MKRKLLMLLLAGVIMTGVGGCEKNGEPKPENLAVCWVFVKTTPGEETILLAKSENGYFPRDQWLSTLADFQSEYGEENISWRESDLTRPRPEAVPYCYEITTVSNITNSYLKRENLIEKEDGDVVIFKFYTWAFTENEIDRHIASNEYYNNKYGYGDKIVSITKKKLGPEVLNMPIEF